MEHRSPSPAAERLALGVILALGLGLRLWGLTYGLPHPLARPDEKVVLERIFGFERGDFNPHWFMYPSFHLYLLWAYLKALVLAAHALGLQAVTGLAELARQDPGRLYLLARSLSVVLGTVTIGVAFLLARTLWDSRAGLLAALVLSVAFLHVRDSHFFKPDVALGLATVATLLGCVHLQRRGTLAAAVLAGAISGIALSIKYSALVLLPVVIAAAQAGRSGVWRRLLAAGAAALVALLLTSPYIALDYRSFAGWMAYTRLLVQYGGEGLGSGFRYHARHSFLLAQGLPLSLFMLGALAWASTRGALLPITAFVVVSVVQLGASSLAYTRYVTPLLPVLAVVTGGALAALTARVPAGGRRAALTAALLVALLVHPLHSSARFDQIAAQPDTRLLARSWLDEHVPSGTTVLVLGAPWPYTFGDPLLDGYRVRRNPTLDPAVGYVVTHEHPVPFSRVPERFETLRPRLRLEATFSPFGDHTEPPARTVFETRDAFYVPLAGFRGVVRGGPVIRIYSVVGVNGAAR